MSENRTSEETLALRRDLVLPPDKTSLPPQTPDPLVNTAAHIAKIRTPELSGIALAQIENKMLAAFDKQYHVQKRRQARRWVAYMTRMIRDMTLQPSFRPAPQISPSIYLARLKAQRLTRRFRLRTDSLVRWSRLRTSCF